MTLCSFCRGPSSPHHVCPSTAWPISHKEEIRMLLGLSRIRTGDRVRLRPGHWGYGDFAEGVVIQIDISPFNDLVEYDEQLISCLVEGPSSRPISIRMASLQVLE